MWKAAGRLLEGIKGYKETLLREERVMGAWVGVVGVVVEPEGRWSLEGGEEVREVVSRQEKQRTGMNEVEA